MSRPPRILSETGMYHIIFRGINKSDIFQDSYDYRKILEIIDIVKKELHFQLFAYCLMRNHTHLFIKEENYGDIKKIMLKILTRYAMWYNHKYDRRGPLIENRYKSEPIEDDSYFLTLLKYIHMNPVKAGITLSPEEYHWSSFNDYMQNKPSLTDTEFAFTLLTDYASDPIAAFEELHSNDELIDYSITNSKQLTDDQAKRKILHITGIEADKIAAMPLNERIDILTELRAEGFTIRQLANVTGIKKCFIEKIK